MSLSESADWISVITGPLGVVFGIVGLWIAIVQLKKATTASQAAADASLAVLKHVARLSTINYLSQALQHVALSRASFGHRDFADSRESMHRASNSMCAIRDHPQLTPEVAAHIENVLKSVARLDKALGKLIAQQDSVLITRTEKSLRTIENNLAQLHSRLESLAQRSIS